MKGKDLAWVLLMAAVVAVSFVAAARRSGTAVPAALAGGPPVTVSPIEGSDLHRVALSARAAERLGIETGAGATVIPYSAVLYDLRGETWVYTNPESLVFVRHRVQVDRIDGTRAVLRDGPPAGTTIVTVGGAELLAAELGH